MTTRIDIAGLRLDYGRTRALDDLTLSLTGDKIIGLLGRNGAGKTSLLSVLAAFRKADAGTVRVDGAETFENAELTSRICLIREGGDVYDVDRISECLDMGGMRPTWDTAYARRLLDRFGLSECQRVDHLSRGKRSALGVVLGLASRAPITIFDEVHLGMDAPGRYAFYEELLADYIDHPRTIIISTHLIEEVASLLEEVVIIDDGRILRHDSTEALTAKGAAFIGDADAVDDLTAGLAVLGSKHLGRTKQVTVYGDLPDGIAARATAAGVQLEPVPLQDLFVHLTSPEPRQGEPR